MRGGTIGIAAIALAGCAGATGEPAMSGPNGECRAEPAQAYIGRKASAQVGAELLEATGAKTIRWVPPRTKVTMDFQPGRLTVTYDDDMVIERISCT